MRRFILGTDWWTDCDDAAALRILLRAHKRGEIALSGIGINAYMPDSAASLLAFSHAEGVFDVPVGIDRAASDFGGNPPYQKRLAAREPMDDAVLPDAADLYLTLLREAEEPLEILEIGYPQVLAEVLKRDPDLFREKVRAVWMMAGKWDNAEGKENNFTRAPRSREAGAYFCRFCPVPVTFLGFEVGVSVITGGKLKEGDLLRQVLADHGSGNGRCSWDPMLVLLALDGSPEAGGYTAITGKASVDPLTGANTFLRSPDGRHRFVVKVKPDSYYAARIDELIR